MSFIPSSWLRCLTGFLTTIRGLKLLIITITPAFLIGSQAIYFSQLFCHIADPGCYFCKLQLQTLNLTASLKSLFCPLFSDIDPKCLGKRFFFKCSRPSRCLETSRCVLHTDITLGNGCDCKLGGYLESELKFFTACLPLCIQNSLTDLLTGREVYLHLSNPSAAHYT